MRFISVAHRLTCTASDAKLSVGTERANFYKKILRAENKKRSHKKRTRDLWNTRREIQTQTKLDQPSYWQHQTPETRPQLQTSRKKRSWTPQETMATRRCRNRSNDLIHGGGGGGGRRRRRRWWWWWWWWCSWQFVINSYMFRSILIICRELFTWAKHI